MIKVVGIIPSRMASSRFPGKPLVKIEGLPMIVHVLERSKLCNQLDRVYVATDSKEIFDTVVRYGGEAIMTAATHQTGTDRIAEAAQAIDAEVIVNIQGDEPLLQPADITKLIKAMQDDPATEAATLVCKTPSFANLTECKVALALNQNILYMSRADIPSATRGKLDSLCKLYCIVAFKKEFLFKFAGWPATPLEAVEHIEYLRILEHGHQIKGVVVEEYTTSVDIPEDLVIVGQMMKRDKLKHQYLQAKVQNG